MPELPDIVVYVEALRLRLVGQELEQIRLMSPFLLRTASPRVDLVLGQTVRELHRIGKRIAVGLEDDYWLVLHLMVAGRLHWRTPRSQLSSRKTLAAFDFTSGSLELTEAGSKRRASLHILQGADLLRALDPGGLEVLEVNFGAFAERLTSANHALKRALTDPCLFSGIGNAYSDEILHRARLSPLALTHRLTAGQIERLYHASRETLREWTERLRQEAKGSFPEKVTAFREKMAVHGKYGKPCPCCGIKVQRIRYAENETNYCPGCQTDGKLLADRALSRLLKEDWPRTVEQLATLTRR